MEFSNVEKIFRAPQRETHAQVSTFGVQGAQGYGSNIACYYTNWSQYRPGGGKYYPEDLDASLCTHLIFSFAKVVRVGDGWGLAKTVLDHTNGMIWTSHGWKECILDSITSRDPILVSR